MILGLLALKAGRFVLKSDESAVGSREIAASFTKLLIESDTVNLVRDSGKSVLLITHDIEEAVLLGDEVIVMSPRPGRILKRFEVPFAQPRAPSIRRDPAFHHLVDEIRALFEESGVL